LVTVRVKGGTPRMTDTLCRTCRFAQIIKGFSASEEEVFCRWFYQGRRISISVFECTMYEDKRIASKVEMEEIAWFLTTRKSGRSVGFVSAAKFCELEELDEANSNVNSKDSAESTE
jgi:hypothetical protein